MTYRIKAIAFGIVLAAVSGSVAHAASDLTSMTVTPLWPTNSNPGNVVLYGITLERSGQGHLAVNLSATGFPQGSSGAFTPPTVRFVGRKIVYEYPYMVVNCDGPQPTDEYQFIVTATTRTETMSVTNTSIKIVSKAAIAPAGITLVGLDIRPNGDVELRGLGGTADSYRIEITTDLANPAWTDVGSCTADGNGRFTFIHDGAKAEASSMRFYRAVKLPPSKL